MNINVHVLTPGCEPEQHGDWIDLKAAEDMDYSNGDAFLIPLGVAMKFPDNYEAHLLPRSSSFKKFGIIMANSMGIIDNAYSGDDDEWMFSAVALRSGHINKGDRIAQFRVMPKMEQVNTKIVDSLGGPNRGGFGSTGR